MGNDDGRFRSVGAGVEAAGFVDLNIGPGLLAAFS